MLTETNFRKYQCNNTASSPSTTDVSVQRLNDRPRLRRALNDQIIEISDFIVAGERSEHEMLPPTKSTKSSTDDDVAK